MGAMTIRLELELPPSGFLTDLEIRSSNRRNWSLSFGSRPPMLTGQPTP
jgi:hypothetical protein